MTLRRLTPAQHAFYAEQGYLHLPGLLRPDEAAHFRHEVHALAERLGHPDATWASVRDTGTRITHCHDVQFKAAVFTRLLLDPRLTEVAVDLIGPDVELHHTKMFIKPPERGSPFPMHQDYHYFPHEQHSMTAVILHFDDAPLEKGCLRVVPHSHRLGPLPTSTPDHTLPQYPLDAATALPARAGDAIFFNYLLVHGSGLNVSREARTTLLIQMRSPTDRPLVNRHRSKGQGMMLAGIDPKREPFFSD